MATWTESANGHMCWVSGAFGQNFALDFNTVAFAQNLCLIDFAHLYFLSLISLFLDIQSCPKEEVRHAAAPPPDNPPLPVGGANCCCDCDGYP